MKKNIGHFSDVFVHNLHSVYHMEKVLVHTLEKLSKQVKGRDIKNSLHFHLEETIMHVKRIEQAFSLAGLRRAEMRSYSLEGLDKDLKALIKVSSSDSKDFLILEAAAKAERLEISSYEALILSCKELDIPNKGAVLDLLRDNLVEEEIALKAVMTAMKDRVPFLRRNIY